MTEFLNPRTLEEALDALAADGDDLRVVSGATDVVVWVRDCCSASRFSSS